MKKNKTSRNKVASDRTPLTQYYYSSFLLVVAEIPKIFVDKSGITMKSEDLFIKTLYQQSAIATKTPPALLQQKSPFQRKIASGCRRITESGTRYILQSPQQPNNVIIFCLRRPGLESSIVIIEKTGLRALRSRRDPYRGRVPALSITMLMLFAPVGSKIGIH